MQAAAARPSAVFLNPDGSLWTEKVKTLEDVRVTTRARNASEELEQRLASGLFAGGNADVFDFVYENQNNVAGFTNILPWLQGRVPCLTLASNGRSLVPVFCNAPAQLFLNEMWADADMISCVSPFNIALVKVYRGNFVGSVGGGSAIAIYTRRGAMSTRYSSPLLPSALLKGYARTELPFAPVYTQEEARA